MTCLHEIVAGLIRIDESGPGMLDDCLSDCWAHAKGSKEVQSEEWLREHQYHAESLGRRIDGLLGVTRDEAIRLVRDITPTTRRQIVAEVVQWYLDRIDGREQPQPAGERIVTPRRQVNIRMEATQ